MGEASRYRSAVGRRGVVRGGLAAGLGAAALLPHAAPAGTLPATPDPIRERVAPSGLAAELVDFAAPPRTRASPPFANLNFLHHAGDGSGRLFVNDARGKLWSLDPATGRASLFLDLQAARAGALLIIADQKEMGFRSFAFHPDFARPGAPGEGRLYTVSTETTTSAAPGVRVFEGPFAAPFHDVVAEWRVDATVPSRVDPASRREVMRIAEHGFGHNADQLMFDPNPRPGEPGHGAMLIGVGDGGNFPRRPDPYDLAQDPGRAQGKILRIDPLPRRGDARYVVPPDNPFVGVPGFLPEIWALGLRHPQNIAYDPGGDGALILTDIGQAHVEEVNLGVAGANYGWPVREGTFVTDRDDPATLYRLPTDDATRRSNYTYPVAQYDHDDGRAIAGGFVYRGSAVPELGGQYLFGDIVNGRVFHVPVAELRLGSLATIRELTLLRDGRRVELLDLVAPSSPPGRVDLRFGQDEAGEVYVLTKQDGRVRRLRPASRPS
jgi:glucose/arabinose dehydrogenase